MSFSQRYGELSPFDARANQFKVNQVLVIEVFTNKPGCVESGRGEKGAGAGGRHFDLFAFSILEEIRLEVVFTADSFSVSGCRGIAGQGGRRFPPLRQSPLCTNVCPE